MAYELATRVGVALSGVILAVLPTAAQAVALSGYPIPVQVNYEQRPLICPVSSVGTFGWTKKLLAAGSSLPNGAAGAVLWQEPYDKAVVVYWKHPIYDRVNDEYLIQLYAVANGRGAPAVKIVATFPYAASKGAPPMSTSGAPAAEVAGSKTQDGKVLKFNLHDSKAAATYKIDPIGYGVDIWAIRNGVGGCAKRLATYFFFKPSNGGGSTGSTSGGGYGGSSGGGSAGRNRIQILEATYGGNVGALRGNVTNHIAQTCNGRLSCSYIIDYRVIGDPVPHRSKDYRVTYRCGGGAVRSAYANAEAGFRKTVTLVCSGA